jgi:hypothetical protein
VTTITPALMAASMASFKEAERGPAMDMQMTADAMLLRAL